jgi:hypothetical protein
MPAFLARRYAADSAVQRGDDAPHVFTWRGRHYVVRSVLDHWWETAAWWTAAQGTAAQGPAPEAVGDDERELWRVEAVTAGRAPVVVELCFAWRTGTWTVDAVMD